MSVATTLDVLLRAGARLGRSRAHGLVSDRVPPDLRATVAARSDVLAWAVLGAKSVPYWTEAGEQKARRHVWRQCDRCRGERLARSDGQAGGCVLTPGCDGRERVVRDPDPLIDPLGCRGAAVVGWLCPPTRRGKTLNDPRKVLAKAARVPCARPGCDRAAVGLTFGLEPLCRADHAHLALYLAHHQENR